MALLGACVGLAGCFQEEFGSMTSAQNDDDGATTGSASSDTLSSGPIDIPTSTTGITQDDDTSTGEPDPTTTGVDESTGSSDSGEESSSSTTDDTEDVSSSGEAALSVDELQPGDLVVTEIMWNPHCGMDNCEWIEILNATGTPVDLLDLYIQDGDYNPGNQGRVTTEVIVAPGDVAVITRGVSTWNYMFDPDAIYGPNPGFNNGSPDRVVLLNSIEILDETATFFDGTQGVAWSLSGTNLDAVSNDNDDGWCDAVDPLDAMTTTEFGSPHVLNPPC